MRCAEPERETKLPPCCAVLQQLSCSIKNFYASFSRFLPGNFFLIGVTAEQARTQSFSADISVLNIFPGWEVFVKCELRNERSTAHRGHRLQAGLYSSFIALLSVCLWSTKCYHVSQKRRSWVCTVCMQLFSETHFADGLPGQSSFLKWNGWFLGEMHYFYYSHIWVANITETLTPTSDPKPQRDHFGCCHFGFWEAKVWEDPRAVTAWINHTDSF